MLEDLWPAEVFDKLEEYKALRLGMTITLVTDDVLVAEAERNGVKLFTGRGEFVEHRHARVRDKHVPARRSTTRNATGGLRSGADLEVLRVRASRSASCACATLPTSVRLHEDLRR
ncbi:MAG: hypothetical protein U1F43_12520 [Myxococcota bacterium]